MSDFPLTTSSWKSSGMTQSGSWELNYWVSSETPFGVTAPPHRFIWLIGWSKSSVNGPILAGISYRLGARLQKWERVNRSMPTMPTNPLAFTTLGCPDWSWERILGEASQMGYHGIEVRGIGNVMHLPEADPFLPEQIEATKDELRRRNLRICGLGSSVRFDNAEKIEEELEAGRAFIDLAAALATPQGTPFVRVFGDKISDEGKAKEIIQQVSQGLEALGQYAESKGVDVLIETHGDFSRSDRLAEVMAGVDSPAVGVLWDTHHPWRFYGEELTKTYQTLKPWIRHLHVKDSIQEGESVRYTLFGEGEMPVKDLMDLLKANEYTGWISLEWEKRWHPDIEEPDVAFPHFVQAIRRLQNAADAS